MVEYAALLQTDFAGLVSGGMQGFVDWLASVPGHWYVVAILIFVLLVKLISNRRV